jgi:hypothetical protein
MCKEFSGRDQDEIFRKWLCDKKTGFYLNKRSRNEWMLHKKGCWHLGIGEGVITTTNPKITSESVENLLDWAREKGLKVIPCSVLECTYAFINKK